MTKKTSLGKAFPTREREPATLADRDRFGGLCREPERIVCPTMDALPANIAILGDQGDILVVNDGWRIFAERNGVSPDTVSEGANYLKVCDEAAGPHAGEARPFAAAMRRILAGGKTPYRREYPCHAPDKERWFLGCVAPFPGNGTRHVLVAHFDISETKRMRRAVRESERRFRDVFAHAPIGMALLDEDGRFLHVNPAYCRITGYSAQELRQPEMTFQQLNHPDDLPETLDALQRMMAGRIPAFFVEKRYRRKDGTVTWVRSSASLRHSPNGGPAQIVSLVEDINERKRAEAALAARERQYRELVETANSIILRWDDQGRIRFINDYGLRYFGYRKSDLLGRPITTLAAQREPAAELNQTALSEDIQDHPERHISVPGENLCRDGTRKWVAWTRKALLDEAGRVWEILAIGNDITELKNAEAALRRSNQELEQFAYVASHDLQEPLRSVVGFLQLLQQRYGEILDEKGRHYIERSVHAGRRMQTLIKDLLTLSRVHTKGRPFRPTDLNQALQTVLEHLEPFLRERDAVVGLPPLPTLPVDGSQIMRLFQNLIVNGAKYNENPRPRVDITVREAPEGWHFSVQDNGIGIAERYHARIFMVFQRLHTDQEYPGTGLGLALCQKIVERHGGRIWVESQPGQGSTFHFTLPRTSLKG